MFGDGHRSSTQRQMSPITAYIGANGSGKSLLAVHDSVTALRAGRRVVSTVRLIDPDAGPCTDPTCTWGMHPDHGTAHPLWVPLTSWTDLLEAEHCDVLLDEVTGIVSSRESSSLPGPIADKLVQLRRADVRLRWTAPAWARADLLLRECTQAAVICRGLLRRRAAGQLWPASTWVLSKMIDARDLDELTQAQRTGTAREATRPRVLVRGLMRIKGSAGSRHYETLDHVSSLSASVERGTCLTCGGRRTQPACACRGAEPRRARTKASANAENVAKLTT